MSQFETKQYLKLVELDKLVSTDDPPSLKLLQLLVKHHALHVVYQNLDLIVNRAEVDLTPSALLNRLLKQNRGGMCYESSELMLKVLLEFKFDARRVSTFCLANSQPHTAGAVDNHQIIIVHFESKTFLVDVGFGYNSIRDPLKFSFDKTEDVVCLPFEKYRLETHEDHYVILSWIKDSWAPFYRFQRPLNYDDDELCMEKYRQFLSTPQHVPIRDSFLKVGKVTDTGRRGFWCKYESRNLRGSPPYLKVVVHNSAAMVSENVIYERFSREILEMVNIPLNDVHFE